MSYFKYNGNKSFIIVHQSYTSVERAGHLMSGKGVKGTQKKPGCVGVGWGEVTVMNLTWSVLSRSWC